MAYKKPQIVAKSAAKKSYVANCPPEKFSEVLCSRNRDCMCGDGSK